MSIKNKGFVLLETIIVMSVLLIGMILLYSNYNRIFMNSGKISYYDNVEDMYTAYYVYLNRDTINTNSNEVVDVSDNEVLKNLDIERIYFIDKDVFTNLYTKEVSNCEKLDSLDCFDGTTIAYLKSIQNKANIDKCKENKDCLTIVKINRKGHYYFAKYEAYNVKPTAFKPSTTTTTTTTTKKVTTTTTTTTKKVTTTTKPIVYSFANDPWATIANNVRNGLGYKYKVGDTKKVRIGGTNYTVRVANNTTPTECNDSNFSQTACGFVVEFADIVEKRRMNPTNTNVGGWEASEMRTYANGAFFNKLPEDLRNVIIETKVVSGHGRTKGETNFTSTDKIYLLSAHEVYEDGTSNQVSSSDTAYNQTRQLDYYKNLGLTTDSYSGAIKKNNSSNSTWWLRAAYSGYYDIFLNVRDSGYWNTNNASTPFGVAPAFRIG